MPDAQNAVATPPSPGGGGEPTDGTGTGNRGQRAWVAESDRLARPILETIARFEPEVFAQLGVPGTAGAVVRLSPDWPEAKLAAYEEALGALAERRRRDNHAALRLDFDAMTAFLSAEVELSRVEDALTLPCPNLAETIVLGLLHLLAGRPDLDRVSAAAARLRRYAGLEGGAAPLACQAEALIRSRLGRRGMLAPWRETLVQDLRNAPTLLAALPPLLAEHRITACGRVLDELLRQLAAYHGFLRQKVLPRCRDDFRLPPELYAAKLRRCGVEMPIDELSHRAESAFGDLRRQLDETARRLARRRGWQGARFPEVLEQLKRDRLEPSEMLDHYARRHRQLDQLVADTGFATLPRGRQYTLRLASEAESAVIPFPHFRWPRFFGGDDEAGEIVLPLISLPGDPYASRAMSWAVAVHEGFPGHALQIARLLEPDVSLARGPLAFNDAAQEGWAVYAEAELSPHLPLPARCLTLHSQLRRAAGAFLEPGLQQGRFTRQHAAGLLRDGVGLSAKETEQIVWRYTVWSPGQATTYFCGHIQLAALRTAVECRLGPAFDRRRYHDALLAQGLLPLSLLRRSILELLGTERRLAA